MKRLIRPLALSLLATLLPLGGASAAGRQQLAFASAAPKRVPSVGGFLRERYVSNLRGPLARWDYEAGLAAFEKGADTGRDPLGDETGKWIEAAVLVATRVGDAKLKDTVARAVKRLAAAQDADGYLGVTAPEARRPVRAIEPYEHYWLLSGLLTYHRLAGDETALRVARALGDFYVDRFGPGAEGTATPAGGTAEDAAPCPGSLLPVLVDPMGRVYQATHKSEYLAWCRWAARLSSPGASGAVTAADAPRGGAEEARPGLDDEVAHLSLLGMLRLYEITGEDEYLARVEEAWDEIAGARMLITGAVGVDEALGYPGSPAAAVARADTCANVTWLRLNQRLAEVTGQARYADVVEKLMWNHLPACQASDGAGFRVSTPLTGARPAGPARDPGPADWSGCLALAELPTLIYGQGDEGYYVNQYCLSQARMETPSGQWLTIEQHTSYPDAEPIAMVIRLKKPETLAISVRVPGWAEGATVRVNYWRPDQVAPGGYQRICREWSDGDMIHVRFPLRPRWVQGGEGRETLMALARGPVVFALDSLWCSPEARRGLFAGAEDGAELAGLAGVDTDCPLVRKPAPEGALGPFSPAELSMRDGTAREGVLVPFANVGHTGTAPGSPGAAVDRQCQAGASYAHGLWLPVADVEPLMQARTEPSAQTVAP